MTEILLVNPGGKVMFHSGIPSRFAKVVPPPMDDDDSIDMPKYAQLIDCRLNTALHNAGVETITDLRRLAHDDERLMRTKNVGNIGRTRIAILLGLVKGKTAHDALAESLMQASVGARRAWFRDLGSALRVAGFTRSIVDELEAYSE